MRVLFLFGTRPEAIKLLPLILAMKDDPFFNIKVCVTAQHREMLDQILEIFDVVPDIDLNLMTPNQSLPELTAKILEKVDQVVKDLKPDVCIIQGDTTTVMAGALACFYNKVFLGHVEAGLRTYNKYSPFPEEINRVLATHLCDIHFAPTEKSKENLLLENIKDSKIIVTGNTVIDTLKITKTRLEKKEIFCTNISVDMILNKKQPFVLVTSHRRENFGEGIESICNALKKFAFKYPFWNIVFPVHLNPNIKDPVYKALSGFSNIYLLEPLDYVSFVALLSECYIVITDSGGVQEEAPTFSKPTVVMRESTERVEAVEAGLAKLVGTDENKIFETLVSLVEDKTAYNQMSNGANPYGDGKATEKIVEYFKKMVRDKI